MPADNVELDLTKDLPIDDPMSEGIKSATIPGDKPERKEPANEVKDIKLPEDKEEKKEELPEVPTKRKSIREDIEDARKQALLKEEQKTGVKPETKVETKVEPKKEEKYKVPVGWTKEAKEQWDSLPDVIKASTAKREEEVSKGFKEYGEKAKRLDTYDNLVNQYAPDYKNFVKEPHEVVERTLQWLRTLNHPNKAQAALQARQLMKNVGIDEHIAKLYTQDGKVNTDPDPQPTKDAFNPVLNDIQGQLAQLQNERVQERAQAQLQSAKQVIDAWKGDKPHFDKVSAKMRQLIETGVVAVNANNPITKETLDESYKLALRLDDESYTQSIEEEKAKVAKTLKEAADKERKQSQVQNSRNASVGLKPTAPLIMSKQPAKTVKRNNSVGQDIREAMKLHRGT